MGNPLPTDRRFDKPALQSMVDLINFSNKSHIPYDQIEADQITPIPGSESELLNTTVRIRLAGAGESGPHVVLSYGRLDIGEYIPFPHLFQYTDLADAATLFDQLKQRHFIEVSADDCTVIIGERGLDGLRLITFRPKPDHMVWTGELVVSAAPSGHLALDIPNSQLQGFVLADTAA